MIKELKIINLLLIFQYILSKSGIDGEIRKDQMYLRVINNDHQMFLVASDLKLNKDLDTYQVKLTINDNIYNGEINFESVTKDLIVLDFLVFTQINVRSLSIVEIIITESEIKNKNANKDNLINIVLFCNVDPKIPKLSRKLKEIEY